MKKTPKILPHLYKSKGTPIFRDTTALPFAKGGPLVVEPGNPTNPVKPGNPVKPASPPSWNRTQLSPERMAELKKIHGDTIFAHINNPNDLLIYALNKDVVSNASNFKQFLDPSAKVTSRYADKALTKDIKVRLMQQGWALDTKTGFYFKIPDELYKELIKPSIKPTPPKPPIVKPVVENVPPVQPPIITPEPLAKLEPLPPGLISRNIPKELSLPPQPEVLQYQMPGYMKSYNFPTVGRYTPLAAKAVQKVTGYDRNFMEGYYDEEGNYVTGELENAREQNRAPQFQGASSLKDMLAQRAYLQSLENTKSFAQGGQIQFERSEYGSDAREQYPDGGPIYTYSKRPGSYYQRAADGSWMISNSSTNNQYVPIDDPTGKRTELLNKNAVVYNAPVQGAPKPTINQTVWENASGTSQKNAIAREKQLQALKMSPVLANQETAKRIENNEKFERDLREMQQRQAGLHEQPLDMLNGLWGAAVVAPVVAPGLWSAAETAGSAALPYIEGALNTSIPGMASIPGATIGNAIGAGFATDAMVNRLPQVPGQISKGDYIGAATNLITGGLDVAGGGLVSPLYQGAKSTASEFGKLLGTEEGLLSNAHYLNPFAGKLGTYNRVVGQDAIDDIVKSGLVRVNEEAGVVNDLGPFGAIKRTTPYPSFAKAVPQKQYANQVIAEGKTPYIISTNRPMKVSNLGRHGRGSTQFPVDETGKYISGFPANEAKIFEFADKPHWLKGYKELSYELPGMPSGSFAYKNITSNKVRPTNTGLTTANLDPEVSKNIGWITSPEYAARRAATTGESLEEIQASVNNIIKDAENAKINLNSNPRIHDLYERAGVMKSKTWWRPAKVEISASAEHPVETLNHEIKHLYSPAIHNQQGLYDNYPTLGDESSSYLADGAEQQVRHLNAREQILAENNLPIDAKLSEEQVREFVDRWSSKVNKVKEGETMPNDFDQIWSDEAGKIQREMLKARYNTDDVNFVKTLPTSQKVKFMSEYRDRLAKNITKVLNKAWATVPAAGGAALLNNSENQ